MKRLLLVLGLLGLGLGFVVFVAYAVRAEPIDLVSAPPNRTPTRLPYPPPDDKAPPRPPQRTLVIPTPRSPITTTAKITREWAIAQAISKNPNLGDLKAHGQLTATAILTTYGEYAGRSNDGSKSPCVGSRPTDASMDHLGRTSWKSISSHFPWIYLRF